MELDVHPELTIEAVNLYKPDLIIAPYLKRKIPKEVRESCVVYGDRGYRGCEGVIVCDSREMRARKASLYRREATEGAVEALWEALEKIERGEKKGKATRGWRV